MKSISRRLSSKSAVRRGAARRTECTGGRSLECQGLFGEENLEARGRRPWGPVPDLRRAGLERRGWPVGGASAIERPLLYSIRVNARASPHRCGRTRRSTIIWHAECAWIITVYRFCRKGVSSLLTEESPARWPPPGPRQRPPRWRARGCHWPGRTIRSTACTARPADRRAGLGEAPRGTLSPAGEPGVGRAL